MKEAVAKLHDSGKSIQIESNANEWVHEEKNGAPFDELILSWNGIRPLIGYWEFSLSLYQEGQWSPWLKYAEWGHSRQATFQCDPVGSFAKTYQDIAVCKQGVCSGFRIRICGLEGASLAGLHSVIPSTSLTAKQPSPPLSLFDVRLSRVIRKSQMLLPHPRHRDLCSPTSTSAAIEILGAAMNPAIFAEEVRDQTFDIYGNWILNTASAYQALQGAYRTYVARLPSLTHALERTAKALPVVLSVKGPLPLAPLPYAYGHLVLLTGYDAKSEQVLCMDPAFPRDEETEVSYPLHPFLEAWGRRRNLAYLFEPA